MLSPEEKSGFEKAENINCVSYCKAKGEPSRSWRGRGRDAASCLALGLPNDDATAALQGMTNWW